MVQFTVSKSGDITKFFTVQNDKSIKKQRDEIAHGAAFEESRLPVVELSDLLMKYLAAHAAQVLGNQKGN